MVHASDALKTGLPGPFRHLAAPARAAPHISGGGRHLGCASFTMRQPRKHLCNPLYQQSFGFTSCSF
eukprot:501851-Pleurochrysis_carterae.AAC.1